MSKFDIQFSNGFAPQQRRPMVPGGRFARTKVRRSIVWFLVSLLSLLPVTPAMAMNLSAFSSQHCVNHEAPTQPGSSGVMNYAGHSSMMGGHSSHGSHISIIDATVDASIHSVPGTPTDSLTTENDCCATASCNDCSVGSHGLLPTGSPLLNFAVSATVSLPPVSSLDAPHVAFYRPPIIR